MLKCLCRYTAGAFYRGAVRLMKSFVKNLTHCAEAFLQIDSNSKQTLILFFLPEINQMTTYYDTEYTQKEEDNCKRKKKQIKVRMTEKTKLVKKKKRS